MKKKFRKIAVIAGVVGVLCVGYQALAMTGNADSDTSTTEAPFTTETVQTQGEEITSESGNTTELQIHTDGQQEKETSGDVETDGGAKIDSAKESEEITDYITSGELPVPKEEVTEAQGGLIGQEQIVGVTEEDNAWNANGLTYYFNMKKYESLLGLYQEMNDLLIRKLEIYRALEASGEITAAAVKQVEAEKVQVDCQIVICENEVDYNQYVLTYLNMSFDNEDINERKSVSDVEAYISEHSEYGTLSMARYVTDCKNAVSNIKAKEAEQEALAVANKQVKLLQAVGEASELEVLNSELAVLKAELDLESLFCDMNMAYYILSNN